MEKAIFAGGCFWCMVKPFDTFPGVKTVISGYTGGQKENPTYEEVCSGTTGHVEAVEITFDPKKITYKSIVELFWQQIDPTDAGGQFCDRGDSYKTAIFYTTEEQKEVAEQSKRELAQSGRFSKEIVTPILPAKPFYRAEEYHQHFYKKNKEHYESYQASSGRAGFINEHWSEKN